MMAAIANDFLIIALAVVLLYKAKPASPFSTAFHEDYLSLESTGNLRGLLSIVIVIHHLAQNVPGLVLFPLFSKLGFQTVAVFFALSGYGLMKQYIRQENYSHKFLRRRLPTIALPYLIATLAFWGGYELMGMHRTPARVLMSFVDGFPIVTPSWFLVGLLMFYVAFRILIALCKKRYRAILVGSVIFCVLYALGCHAAGYGIWWYNTIISIVFGMFWALYEMPITQFFHRRYWIAAPALFLLFFVQYGSKILLNPYIHSITLTVSLTWLTSILFTGCVLVALMKLKFDNPLLRWLGSISLETYLYHYLFILLLRSRVIDITNDFVYVLAVILCTLVTAQAMHWVNTRVLNTYKKICK